MSGGAAVCIPINVSIKLERQQGVRGINGGGKTFISNVFSLLAV
jgi:hypothetical protein